MSHPKRIRELAWAAAHIEGLDIGKPMESWRWVAYLDIAQEISETLAEVGDDEPVTT